MSKLTDSEARQWRNRALDAERELDALIDEFQNPPKPKQGELF